MNEEHERYHKYLCSREWGLLRAAVLDRASGTCERCFINKADAVHHLTYIRKYREHLDDLQAVCNECHEATHGITTAKYEDPASLEYMVGKVLGYCNDRALECTAPEGSMRWDNLAGDIEFKLVVEPWLESTGRKN